MAEDTGNVIQKADANYFLGEVALAVGDYAEADYRYQCGLEFYRSQNSEHGIGLVLSGKGKVAQALGRDTTAESFYQQSLLLFERLENRKDIAQVSLYLGTIAQAAGDYAKTEAYYQRAYHLAMEIRLPVVSTQALCCLALLTCQYGQRQQAQAYLRSAWDIASSQRRDPLLLEVGLTTAMVLLAQLSETHLLPGEAVESRRTVELAYRLLSFVANHSAALFKTRNQAEMKLAELLNMLPSSVKDELSAQTQLPKLEEFSSSWKNLVSPAT